ncbi:hypothetical protein Btru_057710 [Bulinus truncatus]|nr:hypothetical protein Btru_057710 [Bulinus truncatus]
MNKTPVDWEEFEAQAVLIQRLISDQLSSPDSPHFITKLSEPEGLIKLNFESPLTQFPALAFTNDKDSAVDNAFPLKSKEPTNVRSPLKNVTNSSLQNQTPEHPTALAFTNDKDSAVDNAFPLKSKEPTNVRSPLKNVTNSSLQNQTPEHSTGGSLPVSCPTSAEFREFFSKISEISSEVQDSDLSQDLGTSDSSVQLGRNHVRKGTYDVEDQITKEKEKGVTRVRIGTYDTSPSSLILACGIKDFGADSLVDKKNEDVFVEAHATVAHARRLIPPVLTSCSLDDCDTDLTSSDESSDEDQQEETIPATQLLVVIDDFQGKTSSVKKKINSDKRELKNKSLSTKGKGVKTVNDHSKNDPLLVLGSEEISEQVSTDNKGSTCRGSELVSDDVCNVTVQQSAISDEAQKLDPISGNNLIKNCSDNCDALPQGDKEISVPCESDHISLAQSNKSSSIQIASNKKPSARLIPKNMNISTVSELKPSSKIVKTSSQIKRSSLAPQVQAKDHVVERSSGNIGPSIKPMQTKPSQLQTKSISSKDSCGISVPNIQSSGLEGVTVKAGDSSILSRTVTKTQPAVPRVSQITNRLQPPQQTKQIKSPIKSAVPESEKHQKSESVNTIVKPSLLQSRPSFSRGILPPLKANLKPPLLPAKSIQQPVKAAQEPAKIGTKASLTSTKTFKLVKPGFTKLSKPGGVTASLNDSTRVKVNEYDTSHGDGDDSKKPVAIDGSKKSSSQLLARKGPAPVKAIFPPSSLKVVNNDSQAEGSRTVTKEKNDLPRVITDHQIQDGSRTVTRGKPDSGGCHTVTLSSESKSISPTSEVNSHFTPMKSEKFFNPRRLSDVFQSSFSPESAKSEKNGKISKIPTPRSSRLSSCSSSASSSGFSSFRKPSDFKSPFAGKKDSTEDSLSAFKMALTTSHFSCFTYHGLVWNQLTGLTRVDSPKRPLVRYTPDVEPRRQSMWSPVKRNPVPVDEMAYFCTKKLLPGQKPSS